MASTETQLIDAEAFLARPPTETTWREELIGGQIVVNQPRARHQIVAVRFAAALMTWSSAAAGRGQASLHLALRLSDRDVLGPDGTLGSPAMPGLAISVRELLTF
jgi:hypothetical protein